MRIVEPENTFNDEFQISRNREATRATAVRARTVFVTTQVHAKRVVKCLNRAAEFHNPARAILAHNSQAVLPGKRANFFKIRRRRAVQTRKFFAGEIFSLARKASAHLRDRRKFARL
jgi:hypothetical protein